MTLKRRQGLSSNQVFRTPSTKKIPQKKPFLLKPEELSQQTRKELKRKWVDEFRVTLDFSLKNMVSHQLFAEKFRAEVPFLKAGNISNQTQK